MKQRDIKSLMFSANDADKHDVTWSGLAEVWTFESASRGHIHNFVGLTFALEQMARTTGVKVQDFAVSHNPYTHMR